MVVYADPTVIIPSFEPTTIVTDEHQYYPAPPIITSYSRFQDVNNDKNLREKATKFFLKELIAGIEGGSDKKLKKHLKVLKKSKKGYNIVYNLLRLFVRRGNTNWYDLEIQYSLVMDYIRHKLEEY